MPKEWYDRSANRNNEDMSDTEREFNLSIVADKKPYFMRYIYPAVNKDYRDYVKTTDSKCQRLYNCTISDLIDKQERGECSLEEAEFIHYYQSRIPVSMNNCVMNRICRRFEQEFDGYFKKNVPDREFDYTIYKSDASYFKHHYYSIKDICEDYAKKAREYKTSGQARYDVGECSDRSILMDQYKRECLAICSNTEQLANILIDICYSKQGTKQIVWDLCATDVVNNLLKNSGKPLSYPTQDPDGDIQYKGLKFKMVCLEEQEEYENDYLE